jgi:hypothetical protein
MSVNINTSDSLSQESRNFFEHTKMKLALSFFLSLAAFCFIAWTAVCGT